MLKIGFSASLLSLAFVAAACSAPGGPGGSPGGSPTGGEPTGSSSPLKIDHRTGPKDLILRYEVGGGFVPVGFLVTEKPSFSLYGDGTAIFQENAPLADPIDSVVRSPRWKTVHLTEDQVQSLLEFAIGPGGLGLARSNYELGTVADAPTATFRLHAGGLDKSVSVYALGLEDTQSPDFPARQAFQVLAERLSGFDNPALGAEIYRPERYRGVLMKQDVPLGPGEPVAWPWPAIKPTDFASPADPNVANFPRRVLTAEEVAALMLADLEGGATGIQLRSPGGKDLYNLSLRPLLPEEEQ